MITFKIGQELTPGSGFYILNSDGHRTPTSDEAAPIGAGASGAVYRAVQGDVLQRAVKILDPRPDLLARVGLDKLVAVFQNEKIKLATLTHSHLAKLITFGFIPAPPENQAAVQLPYIVMEYVEGVPLHRFLSEPPGGRTLEPATIVDLLDDVLSALQYMHAHNAMHADVKEANVVVRDSDRWEAVLVDLGCAHVFEDARPEMTYFNTTQSRTPKEWRGRVATSVPTADLQQAMIRIDLHHFGVMVALLTKLEDRSTEADYDWQRRTRETIRRAIGDTGLVVLNKIAQRCMSQSYTRVDDVRHDLRTLLPHFVSPLGVPELSLGSDATTSISLPTSRLSITPNLRHLVNHPWFQRLNTLNQLDFIRLVYPGATHTRLLHSLEAYNLTRQYVGALLGDPEFRAYVFDKATVDALWIGGLLHDIGHYPLEHVFEDFAAKRESSGPYVDIPTDSDIARTLLGVPSSPNRPYAREAAANLCQTVSTLIGRDILPLPDQIANSFGQDTLRRLREILSPQKGDIGAQIAKSIIDGPIDVDKVAYLRTDALMTGVEYGHAVDVDSLLSSLTCFPGGDVDGTEMPPSIGIRIKGLCAVESIATARRWMFQRVYWNHTNRAMMAMLRYPIMYLMNRAAMSFEDYFRTAYTLTDTEAVRWINSRFMTVAGDDVDNPAMCLLAGARGIYKRLIEVGLNEGNDRRKVRDYFVQRPCSEWLGVGSHIASIIRERIPTTRDSDVLIDIPIYDRPDMKDVPVFTEANRPKKMSSISDQYKSTQDFFRSGAMLCRVFIHPRLRQEIATMRCADALRAEILGIFTQ